MPQFQFHIGAIKSFRIPLSTHQSLLFQFHIGAIKRRMREAQNDVGSNFNSILVRLKVKRIFSSLSFILYFNSILVRLKVVYPPFTAQLKVHFNSILVRLKGKTGSGKTHAGLISIPYWCD